MTTNSDSTLKDPLRRLSDLQDRALRVEFDVLKLRYREHYRVLRHSRNPDALAALWDEWFHLNEIANRFFDGEALTDGEDA
jgi:hypothetical protein